LQIPKTARVLCADPGPGTHLSDALRHGAVGELLVAVSLDGDFLAIGAGEFPVMLEYTRM